MVSHKAAGGATIIFTITLITIAFIALLTKIENSFVKVILCGLAGAAGFAQIITSMVIMTN